MTINAECRDGRTSEQASETTNQPSNGVERRVDAHVHVNVAVVTAQPEWFYSHLRVLSLSKAIKEKDFCTTLFRSQSN